MNSVTEASAIPVLVYSLLALIAALAGGALPGWLGLTHTRLQLAVSFVAGMMLGLSLLGLLPHAIAESHSVHQGAAWLLAGFLTMFLLQRFLPFHHHDVAEGQPTLAEGCTHTLADQSARHLTWASVALGLSFHSILDGLALAAAAVADARNAGTALGAGAASAVILHKPFGALAIASLMAASGAERGLKRRVNVVFALVTPVSALLFYAGAGYLGAAHPGWLGAALAFCGGTFLCIACLGLLPELQFHTHDRLKLTLALLAGLGVAVLVVRFGHGEAGHAHTSGVLPAPDTPAIPADCGRSALSRPKPPCPIAPGGECRVVAVDARWQLPSTGGVGSHLGGLLLP